MKVNKKILFNRKTTCPIEFYANNIAFFKSYAFVAIESFDIGHLDE